jgi:hypothetical protein
MSVQHFIAKNKTAVVSNPSYSPDLAACNFFLFSKIELMLEGKEFNDVLEIQKNLQQVLTGIMKEEFNSQ